MKKIRLFIADIDGTLRGRNIRVPGPLTCKAFIEMQKRGIITVIASGRPLWQNLQTHYQEWQLPEQFDYLMGLNGGEIWEKKTNTVNHYHPLQPDDIKTILTTMKDVVPHNPFLYRDGYTLTLREDEEMLASDMRHHTKSVLCKDETELWSMPTGKLLFRCYTPENGKIAVEYAQRVLGNRYACFLTNPSLLEIQQKNVSKGTGLKNICDALHISKDEVIAFGDAENDLEMLKAAGWSVSLKNAMDNVKAVTDDITASDCEHDGVGEYLFQHLLKNDSE